MTVQRLQVQCSALEVLPLAPMPKLLKLFTDGELAKHIISCLQSSLPEVRSAAASSVAHLLSSQDLLRHLASSGNLLTAVTQWAGLLGAALSDPAPAVMSAAHAATQRILGSVAHDSCSDAGMLQDKFAGALCQRVVKSLGSILEQAQMFSASEQVCTCTQQRAHQCCNACGEEPKQRVLTGCADAAYLWQLCCRHKQPSSLTQTYFDTQHQKHWAFSSTATPASTGVCYR